MDIGEDMCYGECGELSKTNDSQSCTLEANNILYVNEKKFLSKNENKTKNSYYMLEVRIMITLGERRRAVTGIGQEGDFRVTIRFCLLGYFSTFTS